MIPRPRSSSVADAVRTPSHPDRPRRNGFEQSPESLTSVENISDRPQTAAQNSTNDPESPDMSTNSPRMPDSPSHLVPRAALPRIEYYERAQPTPVRRNLNNMIIPSGNELPTDARGKFLHFAKAFKQANKSIYHYRGIRKDQCRLLYLKPGTGDEPINATLVVVGDDELGSDSCPYEALSYHWGKGHESQPIFINEDYKAKPVKSFADAVTEWMTVESMKERRLYVRPNAHDALKCLRRPDRAIFLWVDALCIWQKDEAEKTIQVMKMAKIYRGAKNVCIWLGPSDETSERAMSFIEKVINLETLGELVDDTKNDQHIKSWASLFRLLRWSWFSRRWVIQELALAREATVHVGYHEINWSDFKDAIGIFQKYFKDLKPKLENPKLSGTETTRNMSNLGLLGAKRLVDLTSNLFRAKPDGSYESTYSLEMLVSELAGFDTADPRDTINSVRNIAKELNDTGNPPRLPQRRLPPEPDYTKNLLEIYSDFLEWVINHSDNSSSSLDILCRHWALPEKESQEDKGPTAAQELVNLPSWILTVDKGSGRGEEVFEGRKAGEPFVGLPGRHFYNASGKQERIVRFSKEQDNSLGLTSKLAVLTAKGLLLGKVDWCSDSIPDGVIPRSCLERLGWNSSKRTRTISKAPPQLWRTLVADRGPRGEPVPSYYHRACLYSLINQTPNGHINTKELLQARELGQPQSIVKDYLERVQAVTWNRVILQGTKLGDAPGPAADNLVGLGPPETQLDDVIAILFGCSVPVILRPCSVIQNEGEPEWYELVGEAYIYGKMDGEAMFGNYDRKDFKLH